MFTFRQIRQNRQATAASVRPKIRNSWSSREQRKFVVADQEKPTTSGVTPSRTQKRPAQGPTGSTPEGSRPKAGGWEAGAWYEGSLRDNVNENDNEYNDSEFDANEHYHLLEREEENEMPGGQGVGPKPSKRAKEQFENKQATKAGDKKKEKDQSVEVRIQAWNDERGCVVNLGAAEWEAVKEDFMAYLIKDDQLARSIVKDFFTNPTKAASYGGFRLDSGQMADRLVEIFVSKPFGPVQLKVNRQHNRESFVQIPIVGNHGWKCMTDGITEQLIRLNNLKGKAKSTDWKDDKQVRGGWFLRIYPDDDLRISMEEYSTNRSELQVGYKKFQFDFITINLG